MKDIGWRFTRVDSLQGVTLRYFTEKKVHTAYKVATIYHTKGRIWVAQYSDAGAYNPKEEKQLTAGQYKSYKRVQFLPSNFQRKVLIRVFKEIT